MKVIRIRPARPVDASNLFRLLEEAHADSGEYPPLDPHMGLNWITQTLSNGYVLVADVSGRLVGTLALTNFHYPWSPQWFLYLEWLFVQRKFRREGAFHALLKAAHAYADSKGAPMLCGVSAGDKDVFLKDKLFMMNGYHYIGGDFVRPARVQNNGGQEQANNDADLYAAQVG